MVGPSFSAALFHPMPGETRAVVTCADCAGDCRDACFNDAIVWIDGGGARIVEDLCAGCGACVAACGRHLLQLAGGLARLGGRPR